ncbi:MAG: lipid IV(A) 3-deoxy-D-manno-octulosonic acid transferase [Burkholderiales bacterium]|nr:lipid IV(A) 3-deoxy-D-manno-octulosonic acid transferase [Burkholderiales bacterium]
MTMARFIYTLLLYAAVPFLLLRLLWRARRQRDYLQHVPERFGVYRGTRGTRSLIWVHAVSVGETRAAEPLIRALQAQYPQHGLLLTHMTPTGRATGAALFGAAVTQCYLPYDHPGAVARFLDHFRPVAGVLLETEIWPNLIQACAARGTPLHLVNARLSARSLRGYQRTGALAREALGALTVIAAQTAGDAERLQLLGGGKIVVTGNLKFDLAPPAQQLEQGRALRAAIGARPVLLAASTRAGEEALLLDAAAQSGLGDALLIIVPRHPQRFDAVADLIAARGLRLQRRSGTTAMAADVQVLLGDTMGEMFMYYAACDAVLLGGSFLPYGAHSLIEPCALGKPVIIGPSVYNFAEAVAAAVTAGAALRAPDLAAALPLALQLAVDPARCQHMGEAGVVFTAAHRGATRRVLDQIRLGG